MSEQDQERPVDEGDYGFAAPEEKENPDPFPRMIIVCTIISAVLFVIIVSVIAWDFTLRSNEPPAELPPPVISTPST